jgi:hypothetical protein
VRSPRQLQLPFKKDIVAFTPVWRRTRQGRNGGHVYLTKFAGAKIEIFPYVFTNGGYSPGSWDAIINLPDGRSEYIGHLRGGRLDNAKEDAIRKTCGFLTKRRKS